MPSGAWPPRGRNLAACSTAPPGGAIRLRSDGTDRYSGSSTPSTNVGPDGRRERFGQDIGRLLLVGVGVGREPHDRGEQPSSRRVGRQARQPVRHAPVGVGRPCRPVHADQRHHGRGDPAEVAVEWGDDPSVEQEPGLVRRRFPARQLDAEVVEDGGARSACVQRVRTQVPDRSIADGGPGATTKPTAAFEERDRDPPPSELDGGDEPGEAAPDDDDATVGHLIAPARCHPFDDIAGRSVTQQGHAVRRATWRRP